MIPDVILFELRLPYSWNLQGLGLVEAELSEVGVQKVEELVKKYPLNTLAAWTFLLWCWPCRRVPCSSSGMGLCAKLPLMKV